MHTKIIYKVLEHHLLNNQIFSNISKGMTDMLAATFWHIVITVYLEKWKLMVHVVCTLRILTSNLECI